MLPTRMERHACTPHHTEAISTCPRTWPSDHGKHSKTFSDFFSSNNVFFFLQTFCICFSPSHVVQIHRRQGIILYIFLTIHFVSFPCLSRYIEDKESAIVWHYEAADPEYGRLHFVYYFTFCLLLYILFPFRVVQGGYKRPNWSSTCKASCPCTKSR